MTPLARARALRRLSAAATLGLLAGLFPAACSDEPTCAEPGGCEPAVEYVLGAEVEVIRDTEGVVHVYGQSDADVWYGSGFMQAYDRLFAMEMSRRQIRGRRAEVLGPDYVEDDALIRRLDLARWGEAYAAEVEDRDPERAKLVAAWVAGVNRRVRDVRDGRVEAPLGFRVLGFLPEEWTTEDAFVIAKAILFDNGNQLQYDLLASLIERYQPEAFEALPFFAPLVDEFILSDGAPGGPSPLPPPARSERSGPPREVPPDAKEKLARFLRRMEPFRPGASNNWAVGPELTADGRSLLSGDPHQPLRSPGLFWLHHMNSADAGGSFDVVGFSFNGTPGISIGHNAKVAWTATTNYPDVTDLWGVEYDGATVKVGDARVTVEVREEQIAVKGADPVVIQVEVVPGYGVLLPDDVVPLPLVDPGRRVLFNWTGYRVTNDPEGFFRFNVAESTADFVEAVDLMELASFNFVAASADDIVYRSSPIVPYRRSAAEHPPFRVMDGNAAESLWTGELLPLEQMPSSNGESGLIVTANNDPFGFTQGGRLDDDPYYFGAFFDPGTRAGRVRQRLQELVAEGPVTAEAMQDLQMDTHSLLADEMVPNLLESVALVGSAPELAEFESQEALVAAAAILDAWDRRMTRDAKAPVLFEAFLHFYARRVLSDDLSFFFDAIASSSSIYAIKLALLASRDPELSLAQEGLDYLRVAALADALAFVDERFGGLAADFTWSDFHFTRFRSESIEELDGGRVATDGSTGTVNVSEGNFIASDPPADLHVSSGGALYRMTATFDEDGTPRAFFNMPRGTSGDPESPHFDDRTEGWVEGEFTLLRFRREDVEAGTSVRYVIAP